MADGMDIERDGAPVTQEERRLYLIERLLGERSDYAGMSIPDGEADRAKLLRALMNMRPPMPADEGFLEVQDAYLRQEIVSKGVVDAESLPELEPCISLWQGDITTLACGAIVNAANSGMTGCYVPCHGCIDNAIHTFAGVQLRLECAKMMGPDPAPEPTGRARITHAWNLPCDHVIHTVGPIVGPKLLRGDEELLESCYRSCLALAREYRLRSIALCCISTGEFHFPNERAAQIAVDTVRDDISSNGDSMKVVFNVFKDLDLSIYRELLG